MPLFHIHGLIAAVSASLAAGGSVWCAPGFDALKFFGWMKEARPTWYTAVPTMHQAILARAGRNAETIAEVPLRFLRSSSASLPGPVMEKLAETFGAPVIEGYGMTEATHQMASNPLPPRAQKPGSVGVEAGPLVRIAHEVEDRLIGRRGRGRDLRAQRDAGLRGQPGGQRQELLRGRRQALVPHGRPGDLRRRGLPDADGAAEGDHQPRRREGLAAGGGRRPVGHPAIAQVVTFALPHPKLGEEVAAAVVLREGEAADEAAIRAFAGERLAAFKVPRKVVILDEIPKGATGKLQRIGLAEKLGLVEGA
jgi:acyl-CoA synthetase (AMP-forming)/AMP-acid ligase II